MSLVECQTKFVEILRTLRNEEDKNKFLRWINKTWDLKHLPECDLAIKEILESIATELRSRLPFEAVLPSENIIVPVTGPNADCDMRSTMHVDEFLYNDGYLDELVEKGRVTRHYCLDCGSRNVKFLNFISHSMSVSRMQYIFKYLLPPITDKTILDVGSRLGTVLFGAYLYTTSPNIIGVEMNGDFCDLAYAVIDKYMFGDRIRIIRNNIFAEMEILSTADVIILNNVFEFFADPQTTITSWHLLAQNLKPGSILVTVPHLQTTFKHIKVDFYWNDWVEELRPCQKENMSFADDDFHSHAAHVKHYRIKRRLNVIRTQTR